MTTTDPPRTPADLSAERAILRWAADRLVGEPALYSVGSHERGHIADLLRGWAAELDTAPATVYQLPAEPPDLYAVLPIDSDAICTDPAAAVDLAAELAAEEAPTYRAYQLVPLSTTLTGEDHHHAH